MNPYAAPGTVIDPRGAAEDDIAAAVPTVLTRAAGGIIALGGAVVALTGLQTLMLVTMRGPLAFAPYFLTGLGLPHLVFGVMVFRSRVWAALVAIGGTVLLTLSSMAWLLFSMSHGLVSLYALGAPCAAVAAMVMSILALGPCQRASAARARLRAQGMDLGI